MLELPDYMKNTRILNEEQLQAVSHGQGPLLIIAGAGTGKTTVVTERIKHLILKKDVKPSEILALTFTEKAAREMEERVDVALPYGYTQMWISTFHAFCDRVLRDEASHIGLDPGYHLMTEAQSILFLRKHLADLKLSYFRPLGNPYKFLQGMLTHFSRLKDDDITPADYQTYADQLREKNEVTKDEIEKTQELAGAYKIYEELKNKESVMDFGDLIANVLKLFRTRQSILAYYQNKFKYVMVDEFQDTNFAQNEMAILLAGETKNISAIGDDDQAIYRWRGAAIANIIQFREHFPDATIITLTKNYRSTEEILDRAYKLIQNNNPDRLEVKEGVNKKLISMRGVAGDTAEFLFGKRVEDEADMVAEKIKWLVEKKRMQYKDIAILVRANDHSQPFTRALERSQIPFQFLGPGHLFHQEEIKDLIAYLKVLYNFEDNAAVYRVLSLPIYKISAREIAVMLNTARRKNLSLFEVLEEIDNVKVKDETREIAKKIVAMVRRHMERLSKDTAGQILYYFVENTGMLQMYLETKNAVEERQMQNIAKFFGKLKTYEAEQPDASVFAVVDWIDLSMQLGESPLAADIDWSENNAVNILTIHSSKGLEFPAVFLVNLVTQRFPTRNRKDQIPVPEDLIREELPEGDYNLQEERRLFYVGVTRARDYLGVTAAHYYGEGKRERKLSPFVYETFGKPEVDKLIEKRQEDTASEQLSLLEYAPKKEPERQTEKSLYSRLPVTFLSYSQIQTFDVCPLHYKLRYLLNLPGETSSALSYGSSVHNVLRDYYQQILLGEKNSPGLIDDLLAKNWINEGYKSKHLEQEAYRQAKHSVSEFIKKDLARKPDILTVETPFNFPIKGIKFGGRIDRVDRLPDGKLEIIDYKTGVNIPDDKKLALDKQMTFYALAAREVKDGVLGKNPEDIKLTLEYIETGQRLTTTRTIDELEEAKQYVLDKAKEINESEFLCSGGELCKTCEYSMLCQTLSG